MDGFFENFETHVSKLEEEEAIDQDQWIIRFIDWLQNFYPPAVIEANIQRSLVTVGLHYLDTKHHKLFQMWVDHIAKQINFSDSQSIPEIKRFQSTFAWFQDNFSSKKSPK
jgi:hypothetical protein